jgi:Holliday junction DNA helicase RuvA
MICRITGRVVAVNASAVVVERDGLWYEVLAPAASMADLQRRIGDDVALHTFEYLEGNLAGSNLLPRLVGFLSQADRDFFNLLTRVKGISIRRALKAMAVATPQIAAAIAHGDERLLTSLPEIGKKTASQIIAELRNEVEAFLSGAAVSGAPTAEFTDAQKVALEILVQWGDRRADAQRWIAVATQAEPGLTEPDAIVRAAYRAKTAGA